MSPRWLPTAWSAIGGIGVGVEPLVSPPPGSVELAASKLRGGIPVRRIVALGLLLGTGFGLWNLIATWVNPLADDDLIPLLAFYGPMFAIWGIAGFAAARETGRLLDAVKTGATVASVSFAVYTLAAVLRVNLFLNTMTARPDWQNLMRRFEASGFRTLRGYVNYEYATGAPFKIFVASMIGVVVATVGGLFEFVGRRKIEPLP
jgi:hypothetical protein